MFKLIPGVYKDAPCVWCLKTGINPKCTLCKGRGLIHQYMGPEDKRRHGRRSRIKGNPQRNARKPLRKWNNQYGNWKYE